MKKSLNFILSTNMIFIVKIKSMVTRGITHLSRLLFTRINKIRDHLIAFYDKLVNTIKFPILNSFRSCVNGSKITRSIAYIQIMFFFVFLRLFWMQVMLIKFNIRTSTFLVICIKHTNPTEFSTNFVQNYTSDRIHTYQLLFNLGKLFFLAL